MVPAISPLILSILDTERSSNIADKISNPSVFIGIKTILNHHLYHVQPIAYDKGVVTRSKRCEPELP
jgi:hypothetical protein